VNWFEFSWLRFGGGLVRFELLGGLNLVGLVEFGLVG
jgi:hypothetical protein